MQLDLCFMHFCNRVVLILTFNINFILSVFKMCFCGWGTPRAAPIFCDVSLRSLWVAGFDLLLSGEMVNKSRQQAQVKRFNKTHLTSSICTLPRDSFFSLSGPLLESLHFIFLSLVSLIFATCFHVIVTQNCPCGWFRACVSDSTKPLPQMWLFQEDL